MICCTCKTACGLTEPRAALGTPNWEKLGKAECGQKQIRGTKVYCSSQFKVTGHPSREDTII